MDKPLAFLEIRALRAEDDRSVFSSGEPAIDRFFAHYAGQNQFKLNLAVTYVAVRDDAHIVGFATVAAGHLMREDMPDERARRRLPAYPLPILRLARLGVDQRMHGFGVGRALLRHVLNLSLSQRDSVGCVGVVTDAKPGAVDFYKKFGFAEIEGVQEGRLSEQPTPMFLGVQHIAAALSEG